MLPADLVPPLIAIPMVDERETDRSAAIQESEPARRRLTAVRIVPWTVSLLVHATLVVALGAWVVSLPARREVAAISASLRSPVPTPAPTVTAVTDGRLISPAISGSAPGSLLRTEFNSRLPTPQPPVAKSTERSAQRAPLTARADAPQYAPPSELTASVDQSGEAPTPSGRPQRRPTSPTGGGIVAMADAATAADSVLGSIRRENEADDLLVVWLLDASLSLLADRQIVAEKMEPFYREIQARQGNPHVLMSAAVAFGATVKELQPPTRYGVKLVKSTSQEVPIDATGVENVMSAVEWCVQKYRKAWKQPMLIVVWTDESGDDILRLEETIAYCRQQGVAVTVVGPTAVFGSEQGLQPYTDAATGYRFLLPVKRGPDTSLPERIPLPYWHESSLPAPTVQGAQVDAGLPWYGGAYREGLLSGVGPYALTRLALQTGGQFLQLARPGESAPFRYEQLLNYLPAYGSAAEYWQEVQYHPLRRAVLNAVQLAYREHAKLAVPRMSFLSYRLEFYPFPIVNGYVTAARFRADLKDEFEVEARFVLAANQVIEQALADFGPDGLEPQYEREESPRWKAWYDLTRGRLLATSVRQAEYLYACKLVLDRAGYLNADTNHIEFVPSERLLSTDERIKARSAEATRLLKRCLEQNPGTPWALLAQWELAHAAGLDIRQAVIPPPLPKTVAPAAAPAPVPPLPRF